MLENKENVNTKEEGMKNINKIMKNVAIKIRIIKAMVLPMERVVTKAGHRERETKQLVNNRTVCQR